MTRSADRIEQRPILPYSRALQGPGASHCRAAEAVADLVDGTIEIRSLGGIASVEQVRLVDLCERTAAHAEQADASIRIAAQPDRQQLAGDRKDLVGAVSGRLQALLPRERLEVGSPDFHLDRAGAQRRLAQATGRPFREPQELSLHGLPIAEVGIVGLFVADGLLGARRDDRPIVDSRGALARLARESPEDRLEVMDLAELLAGACGA
jgi:hypothetical protein